VAPWSRIDMCRSARCGYSRRTQAVLGDIVDPDVREPRRWFHVVVAEELLPLNGAPRRARDLVTEACLRCELSQLAGAGCIVISELVTNSVVHAGTMLTVTIRLRLAGLYVSVEDGSPERPKLPDHRSFSGLRLVSELATAWGCRPRPGGKEVWAALDTWSST
jgi:hypothetical protein